VLALARDKLKELVAEIIEDDDEPFQSLRRNRLRAPRSRPQVIKTRPPALRSGPQERRRK